MEKMMTDEIDDGGPAYPAEGGSDSGLHAHPGMSLRDWFTGKALAGLASDGARLHAVQSSGDDPASVLARTAYAVADAMLAVSLTHREKKGAE